MVAPASLAVWLVVSGAQGGFYDYRAGSEGRGWMPRYGCLKSLVRGTIRRNMGSGRGCILMQDILADEKCHGHVLEELTSLLPCHWSQSANEPLRLPLYG